MFSMFICEWYFTVINCQVNESKLLHYYMINPKNSLIMFHQPHFEIATSSTNSKIERWNVLFYLHLQS